MADIVELFSRNCKMNLHKPRFVNIMYALFAILFCILSQNSSSAQNFTPIPGKTAWRWTKIDSSGSYVTAYERSAGSACQAIVDNWNSKNRCGWPCVLQGVKSTASKGAYQCIIYDPYPYTQYTFSVNVTLHCFYAGLGGVTVGIDAFQDLGRCLKPPAAAPVAAVNQCPIGVSQPLLPAIGNPIEIASGQKTERAVDYESGDGRLSFARVYRYGPYNLPAQSEFGLAWRGLSPFRGTINAAGNPLRVDLMTAEGIPVTLQYIPSTASWQFQSGVSDQLRWTAVANFTMPSSSSQWSTFLKAGSVSWTLVSRGGERAVIATEPGSRVGDSVPVVATLSEMQPGYAISYSYGAPDSLIGPRVSQMAGPDGRTVTLTWNGSTVTRATWPDATYTDYSYDNPSGGSQFTDRLVSATRKSSTGQTLWSRQYLYEDPEHPYGLTGKLDALGNRLSTFSYNEFGQAIRTERGDTTERFDLSFGPLTAGATSFTRDVVGPLGKTTRYTFLSDAIAGQPNNVRLQRQAELASAQTPARELYYSYTGLSATGFTNARGTQFQSVFDALRRPTARTLAAGTPVARTEQMTWDASLDRPLTQTRPGLLETYTYDAAGRMLSRTQQDTTTHTAPYSTAGQTRTWTFEWTASGKLSFVNGPLPPVGGQDDITSYFYDANDNLIRIVNPLGHETLFSNHDPNGRPGRMVDANGLATDFSYDFAGRVLTRTVMVSPTVPALNPVTSFGYDAEGRLTSITSPETSALVLEYNPVGRLVAIRDTTGARIEYSYDAMGNRTTDQTKDPAGVATRTVTRTFDDVGRMLTEVLGAGRTRAFGYDLNDNITLLKDARNQDTTVAFDALDRATNEVDPLQNSTATTYNQRDELVSFTDRIGVATTFVRNGFGDIIQEVSPDRGTSIYRYNAAGILIEVTDGRGQKVTYNRDMLGRLTSKVPDGFPDETVTYVWDTARIGQLTSMSDASGITSFGYDVRGNIASKTVSISGAYALTTGYSYDLADRITTITYPSGRIVTYARDALGRVSGVTMQASAGASPVTLASAFVYQPMGPLATFAYGNDLRFARDWGGDQRLYRKSIKTAGGTALWEKSFSYDADDNITSISDATTPARSATYAYDAVSRLTQATGDLNGAGREDYVYDGNGNRLELQRRLLATDAAPVETSVSALTPGTNRLGSVTTAGQLRQLAYDGRGNITTDTRSGIPLSLGYDAYGRLTSYVAPTATMTMRYSGTDERVEAVAGAVARRFAYDESQRTIGEYGTSASDVKAEHIWLMPDLEEDGYEPLALAGPSTITFVHGDHLGAPALLTNTNGAVVNRYDVLPFGQRWASLAASPTTALAFPGQLIDAVDRHYNLHRDYDPTLGRYIQADPIGLEGGDNPYAYVEGDPVGFVDPDGLQRGRGGGGSTPRGDPLAAASIAQSQARAAAAGVPGPTFLRSPGSGFSRADAVYAQQFVQRQIDARAGNSQCRFGDLTNSEVRQIQKVVNRAGRPLEVVGSAAAGARRGVGTDLPIGKGPGTRSDIDYLAPPSSLQYFQGIQQRLPGIDPKTGIIPGTSNPNIGPSIRFEPK